MSSKIILITGASTGFGNITGKLLSDSMSKYPKLIRH
jgi:NADP-dependent 3-hydroxy acid dehydrogenase YdfG